MPNQELSEPATAISLDESPLAPTFSEHSLLTRNSFWPEETGLQFAAAWGGLFAVANTLSFVKLCPFRLTVCKGHQLPELGRKEHIA